MLIVSLDAVYFFFFYVAENLDFVLIALENMEVFIYFYQILFSWICCLSQARTYTRKNCFF